MQNLGTQTEAVEYLCTFLLSENVKETECTLLFLDKSIHFNADQRGQCCVDHN